MKKRLALLVVCLALNLGGLAVVLFGQEGGAPGGAAKEAPNPAHMARSHIVHVTVYPDSALVTREVEVPEGMGSMELVVSPLPQQTVNNSLYSESSEGIRVLTTRFRTRPVKEDTREEVRKLEDEARKLKHEAQKLQAQMQACKSNTGLLDKLEGFTSASTKNATEKGKLDAETTIALAKYLMDGRMEKAQEMVTLQQKLEETTEQSNFVARKLANMTAGSSKMERDAIIIVDKTRKEAGKVRLNYLVKEAAWKPQYKFRAGKTAIDPVEVEYLASVVQQTGEEWKDVQLVLSTAQPMLNAAPPDLQRLAVTVISRDLLAKGQQPGVAGMPGDNRPGFQGGFNLGGQFGLQGLQGGNLGGQIGAFPGTTSAAELNKTAQMLRMQAQQEFNQKKQAVGNEFSNVAGALEQARDLVLKDRLQKGRQSRARRNNEGPSVTYHLATRLTVPSRHDEQVIEVARFDMKPDYFYKAVPVLSRHVYRQAKLTNQSKYILLPGEATMYHGKDFVGRMNLPLVAIGEEFTAGFGTEPQLQVQRQLMDREETTNGGNRVLTYDYRILVSSYKEEPARVEVWDRMPLSQDKQMLVTLVKSTPEVSTDPLYERENRPRNLLLWDLKVDPKMSGEKALKVSYQFKLELERTKTFGSFQSK